MNYYPNPMPRPTAIHVSNGAQHAQHALVRTQGGPSHNGAVNSHLVDLIHSAGINNKDINSLCKITDLISACSSVGGHAGAARIGDAHVGAPDAQGKKKKKKKTKVHTDIDGIPRAVQTAPTYTPAQKHYTNQVNALGIERRHVDMSHLTSMNKYDVIAFILQREKEVPHHDETLSLYQYMQKCEFKVQEQYKQQALVLFPEGAYKYITMEKYTPIEVRPKAPPHDPTTPVTSRKMPSASSDLRRASHVPAHTSIINSLDSQVDTEHVTFGAEVPSAYRV